MNKRILAAAAAAALMAVLAGCMPVQGPQSDDAEGGAGSAGTQQNSSSASNPFQRPQQNQQTQEPETVDLTVSLEGTTETVKATVYVGGGYTIAIPEGWERSDREPQWNPEVNDDVELTVRFYKDKKADAVAKWFQRNEDDYIFEQPAQTALAHVEQVTMLRGSETDAEESEELIAYFVDTSAGCYGIILECPTEAAEGFGAYLGAMANSFTLTEATK